MGAGESAGYWNLWLLGSKLKKIRRKMCDVNHFSIILLFYILHNADTILHEMTMWK